MKANVTLDCTGLYCPMPIIGTTDKLRELEIGQVLEVLADDKGIKTDMPAWCESTGNEFLGIEEEDGEYRVYVKKRVE
jgi:tRNA 2-thiouridine synthesizing protein A